MSEWWLVNSGDLDTVRQALESAITMQEELCNRDGCLCALGSEPCAKYYRDALHALESGMHQTDAVPADWVTE